MELTDSLKTLFVDTARSLKGSARRLFMGFCRKVAFSRVWQSVSR
jgi:hypothetical protein